MVRRLRPRVEQLGAGLLDAVERRGSMELIADLAYPLPVAVICELLGVPAEDGQRLSWEELFATIILLYLAGPEPRLREHFVLRGLRSLELRVA